MSSLPNKLTFNSLPIDPHNLPDTFAEFFSNKVTNITRNCLIDDNAHNGSKKINCNINNFITGANIVTAIKSLKSKNCESFDRIPVKYLIDGISVITLILTHLFSLIYETKTIPQQWSISKVNPIHKKSCPNKIENNRPIANLCSTTKIFEKLILMPLTQIKELNNISITGKSQHGLEKITVQPHLA